MIIDGKHKEIEIDAVTGSVKSVEDEGEDDDDAKVEEARQRPVSRYCRQSILPRKAFPAGKLSRPKPRWKMAN